MSEFNPETTPKPAKRQAKRTRKSAKADLSQPLATTEPGSSTISAIPEVISENGARRSKRRRGKKGKSTLDRQTTELSVTESTESPVEELQEAPTKEVAQPTQRQKQVLRQTRLDPAELSRKAWKIYLAEVSEEGIALINDHEAREIAKHCFRIAELFLDEQTRHS